MKLGEMLIQEKLITEAQLNQALDRQDQSPGKKLGEILLDLGFISPEQLVKVVEKLQ
jgi:type IV pilus assembly protein PilB